jgi:hypothetical protein
MYEAAGISREEIFDHAADLRAALRPDPNTARSVAEHGVPGDPSG